MSTGAISDASSLSCLQGIRSGPTTLDGLISSSSFLTPSSLMTCSEIGGYDGPCSLHSLNMLNDVDSEIPFFRWFGNRHFHKVKIFQLRYKASKSE